MGRNTIIQNLLSMNNRKLGIVSELIIQQLGKFRPIGHKHCNMIDCYNNRCEVASSIVRQKRRKKNPITEDNLLDILLTYNNSYDDVCDAKSAIRGTKHFDVNINHLRIGKFDYLYYMLYFSDMVMIFRISHADLMNEGFFSNKQTGTSTNEGQFHITEKSLHYHIDNYLINILNYETLIAVLSKQQENREIERETADAVHA